MHACMHTCIHTRKHKHCMYSRKEKIQGHVFKARFMHICTERELCTCMCMTTMHCSHEEGRERERERKREKERTFVMDALQAHHHLVQQASALSHAHRHALLIAATTAPCATERFSHGNLHSATHSNFSRATDLLASLQLLDQGSISTGHREPGASRRR